MIVQPTWLGQHWYPGGFPLKPEQITVKGKTVQQIFLDGINEKGEAAYSADDEETLKSYIVYYINAPLFDNEFSNELRQLNLMQMHLDDVIMKCMEFGLDPL